MPLRHILTLQISSLFSFPVATLNYASSSCPRTTQGDRKNSVDIINEFWSNLFY